MQVLFLSPAYPPEMIEYTRGLAEVGAKVLGVGDTPAHALPERVKPYLSDYLQVPSIMNEGDLVARVKQWLGHRKVDRVEAQWEILVLAAARLREVLGVSGMSYDTVLGFRDKQLMKERVAKAGLRVPYAFRARTEKDVRDAAHTIGFPVILKPIAGAGSADTYRIQNNEELERILPALRHVPEVSVEEFVDGEEFTFDTICIDGEPVYMNVAQYLPRPLIARTNEWISPVIVTVSDLNQPKIRKGIELGKGVLKALGMGTGFTHMEWYLKSNGEVVFGEIGCRPGGAHLVDQMNYTNDIDLFREWARVVCWRHFAASQRRVYNTAIIFKRAQGEGYIRQVHGLEAYKRRFGQWLCAEQLLPVGAHRRNWKQTLVSDGFLIVRHPRWEDALMMADAAATDIQMFASR
ncbi:MAG: ATP-grasp domain-containing protein [Myxococcales bacterium]|nr:ATP-grasp domain-containing protein [Myxococcales bacterium]MCB9643950.1 ATP-grasp domain-containing protein [Myxococcales bacterium]